MHRMCTACTMHCTCTAAARRLLPGQLRHHCGGPPRRGRQRGACAARAPRSWQRPDRRAGDAGASGCPYAARTLHCTCTARTLREPVSVLEAQPASLLHVHCICAACALHVHVHVHCMCMCMCAACALHVHVHVRCMCMCTCAACALHVHVHVHCMCMCMCAACALHVHVHVRCMCMCTCAACALHVTRRP